MRPRARAPRSLRAALRFALFVVLAAAPAPGAVRSAPLPAAATTPAAAAARFAPRVARDAMMAGLREAPEVIVVWGTRAPATRAVLEERARAMVRRLFGSDSTRARPDTAVAEADLHAGVVVLLGGPRENLWSARLTPRLPVSFEPRGFRWQGTLYDRAGEAIHLVYPNPLAPDRFLMLVAGNSAAALGRRGGGFFFGAEDWRIYRDGEIVRSGHFAQEASAPWRYDPALDRDRDRERERFAASLSIRRQGPLELRAPAGLAAAAGVEGDTRALDARLVALGLVAPREPGFRLTLFASLEQKGALTRSTRVEELDPTGVALAALPAGRRALDLWSLAAQRLVALGASRANPWLEPAGAWCAQRWGGEPLPAAVARLYFGRLLPTAAEAAARPVAWRSPLIEVPARALLVGAVLDVAGARHGGLLAMLGAEAPGTLDSLCRLARTTPRRVTARYAVLADSVARAGERTLRASGPRAWRPGDGFMRGVCLAHAVSLEHGYLSAECDHEIGSLAAMGCGWVSLTPFGYLPGRDVPEILPGAEGGPDEENDEAVCEAAARARARGLRVWLKPHLWTRGWVGDLEFSASDWPRFFGAYRAFLLHYALLADRERLDGLTVGHELASTSRRFPDRWRALIGDVRRVYRGSLSYDANWDEAGSVSFWDALDVIGVSFYRPLAKAPTRDASTLRAGARQALQALAPLAARWHRPVLIAEVGYAPTADAPVRPWVEERSGPVDVETQRACYEAVVQAMEDQSWLAGAFWWKWFSSAEEGGAGDASYSPRGKPAEAVLRAALDRWRHRVVAVPGTGAR